MLRNAVYNIHLIAIFYCLSAQVYVPEKYDLSSGLPHEFTTSITIDKKGFIWVGTFDGLCFYDGYKFIKFRNNPFDSNSLSGNYITSLYCDSMNRLWVTTGETGVTVIDQTRRSFLRLSATEFIDDLLIKNIAEDSDKIWVASLKGISSFQKSNLQIRRDWMYDELDKNIRLLYADSLGLLTGIFNLISFKSTLTILNPNADARILTDQSFKQLSTISQEIQKFETNCLFRDGTTLWIGGKGILQFTNDKNKKYYQNSLDGTSFNNVFVITRSSDGTLWIGTDRGLFVEKMGHFVRPDLSVPKRDWIDTQVWGITEDLNGNIWVSISNGILKFSKLAGLKSRLNFSHNTTMYKDSEGLFWIGKTFESLDIFDSNGNKVHFPHLDNLKNVTKIVEARGNQIFIGSYDGIRVFDKRNNSLKIILPDLRNQQINTIVNDPVNQTIWIAAANKGLINYNPQTNTFTTDYAYLAADSTLHPFLNVRVVYFSNNQDFWVGSYGAGLFRFDPAKDRFVQYANTSSEPPLSSDLILSMCEDSNRDIWVGTRSGLNRLRNGKRIQYLDSENGLSNSVIEGIIEGSDKNLYVSTLNGLNKINITTGIITTFKASDGLPVTLFSSKGTFKDNDSTLYFTGINGVLSFRKLEKNEDRINQPIYITSLLPHQLGKELVGILNNETITLDELNSSLTIRFSSIDYTDSYSSFWYYRTLPDDETWQPILGTNEITFTSFSGGNHQIEISRKNPETPENQIQIASLFVEVTPLFWKTLWFRLILTVLILSSIIIPFYLREVKRNELTKLRSKIARDLHDEVGSQIIRVSTYAELISRSGDQSKLNELQQKITQYAKLAIRSMGDSVWILNSENDNCESLIVRMIEFAQSMFPTEHVKLSINVTGIDSSPIDTFIRQNLLLIFKEIITNVVKHSSATTVKCDFQYSKPWLYISVSDNGIGLSESKPGGNGLKNIQKRATLIDCHYELENLDGVKCNLKTQLRLSSLNKMKKITKFYNYN